MRSRSISNKISVGLILPALLILTGGQAAHADETQTTASSSLAATEVTITAVVTELPEGGQLYTYNFPDGGVMIVPYPAADFNPLTASDRELEELYFDPRPAALEELATWTSIMEHYERGEAPSTQIRVPDTSGPTLSTAYGRLWSGWEVGQPGAQAATYLAVKGTFKVPTILATSSCTSDRFGIWLGLGGNSSASNDLVQQGLLWCWGTQPNFRPFMEFANTESAQYFCGYSSWTISSGHEVFQSLSYDTRAGVANFWLSDLGPNGVTHNCVVPKPAGWNFNGAMAEWAIERAASTYPDYNNVVWSGAQVETSNDLMYHSIGSQPNIKLFNAASGQPACQTVSSVGTGDTFTIGFLKPTC